MPLYLEISLGLLGLATAIASAIAAWKATAIARMAFAWQKMQSAPDVRVRVTVNDLEPSLMFILIENVGSAAAYDVKFDFDKPIPRRAYGFIEGATEEARRVSMNKLRSQSKEMDDGPLITGIPAIAAGDKRILTWGQYGGLYSWFEDSFVRVTATFKDDARFEYKSLSLLEVKSFETTDSGDRDPLRKIAKNLEPISEFYKNPNFSPSKAIFVESANARRRRDHAIAVKNKERLKEKEESNASNA